MLGVRVGSSLLFFLHLEHFAQLWLGIEVLHGLDDLVMC